MDANIWKDGKSETQNVSDAKNFRQEMLNLNYIWFFRIKEFIFKTIQKYAPKGSSQLPITGVSGDLMPSSDVCGHLCIRGIYNLYINSYRPIQISYLKVKHSAIKRQPEPMYRRALQFLWMCDPPGKNMVYQCNSGILLYSEFRTVLLAIKFRRVKPIKAYSTSFDCYLCAHGI